MEQHDTNIEFWRGEMSQSIKDLSTQLLRHDELHKQMLAKQEEALSKIESISDHMSQVDALKAEIETFKKDDLSSIKKELDAFKRIYYIGIGATAIIMFIWSVLKEEITHKIFGN